MPISPSPPNGMTLNGSIGSLPLSLSPSLTEAQIMRAILFITASVRWSSGVGYHRLANEFREIPESALLVFFHRYWFVHYDFDFSFFYAPVPPREDGIGAVDGHGNYRCSGFEGEQKTASFEGEDLAFRATGPLGKDDYRDACFDGLPCLFQAGPSL